MFIHKMGKKEKLEGTLPRSSNSAVSSMDVISDSSPMCRNTPTWTRPCGSASSDWLSQSVASSTSWSDELDADATRSLQEQWRIVEGTLYRDGDPDLQLPANSPLRDECRLWQKHFPHLRVLGKAIGPSVACQTRSRHEEAEEQIEEIIAAHGDYDTDRSNKIESLKEDTSDSDEMYKEKLKKAVIDQIFTRIWPDVVKKIEPILRRAADNRKIIFSDSPELKWMCNDRISDEVPRQFNSLSIADLSLASIRPKSERSVLSVRNYNDSLDDVMTREFNSLTITEDYSSTNVRPRSGRSVLSARKNASALLPVKPVVLECQIPLPNSATVRISSAVRKSPVRLAQPSLQLKHLSPERLLSPLVLQPEVKTTLKSAGSRKLKTNERKQETRHYPQYDAKTGRMISRDDSRSGLRRNLKTSPPIPMSRHVTLPPIETCEIFPKLLDNAVQYSRSTRSSSAFLRGGRLSHSSRPTSKARCFS